jgi:ABC-2 type transport system permease protein
VRFLPLVENEVLKLWKRRRFRLVVLILVVLIATAVYGSTRNRDRMRGGKDWRVATQERVARMRNAIRQGGMPDSQKAWVQFEAARLQYYLDRGMDPEAMSGPIFARGFANFGSWLLLHLLSIVFAADIVSSEFSEGTIKLLLTRPVLRSRVLAAKLLALMLAIGLTVLLGGTFAYLFGGIPYGYRGWTAPMLTGFRQVAGTIDPGSVRAVPIWQDAIAVFGLAWFGTAVIGMIGFLASVVLRSTAASMGTMFAALILGTILPRIAPSWEFQKYLFPTNLTLPDFYSGAPPPIAGMTLGFSVATLAVWGVAAVVTAFVVFARRDVLA